jgi:hypothetical protein
MMYIHAYVTECDITGRQYAMPVKGAYALARGATGRWCPVLAYGPEEVERFKDSVISADEAAVIIEGKGDWLDY